MNIVLYMQVRAIQNIYLMAGGLLHHQEWQRIERNNIKGRLQRMSSLLALWPLSEALSLAMISEFQVIIF